MIEAYGKRILCLPIVEEQKVGSIILAKQRKEYQTAQVVSVGDCVDYALDVGTIVFAHRDSGLLLEQEGKPYISFREDELLAYLEDDLFAEKSMD